MTLADIERALRDRLGPYLGGFPLGDFRDDLIETYGFVHPDDVPDEEFWNLFDRYDSF